MRMCAPRSRNFTRSRRRIASSQGDSQFFLEPHPDDRRPDIFSDVVSERAQRRNVNASDVRAEWAAIELLEQSVKNSEKRRQRFAAPGWRSQKDRFATENGRHAEPLGVREIRIRAAKPTRQLRMQAHKQIIL